MDLKVKIAEIANIESSTDAEAAARDYKAAGAEVRITRQADGRFLLEAWVSQGAKYPASGQYLR